MYFSNTFVLDLLLSMCSMAKSLRIGQSYRCTSLISITPLPGPYSRTIPRVLWWSQGGGLFLMSEVPLQALPTRRLWSRNVGCQLEDSRSESDWYLMAEQPAPALHRARPDGRAAPRFALVTVPRVGRSCELFPNGSDLNLPTRPETLTLDS